MEDTAELLARLRPVLEEVFSAYGLSEDQARLILQESLALLIAKRWDRANPSGWLLRTVIERCRRVALEEFGDFVI
ncbi:MAG: hypothetical protein ACJ75H_22250 [Thermoanaerobaculia bacterium]